MNWLAAWKALAELEGDAWDVEGDRLDKLWKDIYRHAFVAYALSRGCWLLGDAETWSREMVDEALVQYRGSIAPEPAARVDVLECEVEE